MLRIAWLLGVLTAASGAWGATFTVTKVADSGPGSLRQAILDANAAAGNDTIVFAAGLSGKTISPLSPLPEVGAGTTINGDTNGNGAPDVRLRGVSAGTESGLRIVGNGCRIYGLSIVGFPDRGIRATAVTGTIIQSCHLGVDLAGAAAGYNAAGQLLLDQCDDSTVGGPGSARNIIAGGDDPGEAGLRLEGGSNNVVAGNYIGTTRDGSAALGHAGIGIAVFSTDPPSGEFNYIGASGDNRRNVLGGLDTGLALSSAQQLKVRNNFFGLTADGAVVLPINKGIDVFPSCSDLTIGGTTRSLRNVFAGDWAGIRLRYATPDVRVMGNWFGTNGSGTETRRLALGVAAGFEATAITVGGSDPAQGNYFTPSHPNKSLRGCSLTSGPGALVQNNHFGVLPNGTTHPVQGAGVEVGTLVYVRDNEFAKCAQGIYNGAASADGRVFGNLFRGCHAGVVRAGGALLLGNAAAGNDGNNHFALSNTWAIRNEAATNIKAEGNTFGSTSKAVIDAEIYDTKDNPAYGAVDYTPLAGGVVPTGGTGSRLALTGAAALPTAAGAEIAFSLSAPAEVSVEVLNLAGRIVAHPVAGRELPAGLTRLSWSGLADTGTAAPAGQYLVRIRARGSSGEEASALAPLSLRR